MEVAALDVGPKHDRTAFVSLRREYAPVEAIILEYRREWEGKRGGQIVERLTSGGKKERIRTVDFVAVERAILAYYKAHPFQEMLYDPYQAAELAQRLKNAGVPVLEFPQTNDRLTPMSNCFYQAVKSGLFVRPADADLDRQAARVVAKQTERGWRISKQESGPIDSIVACAMACWRLMETGGPIDWEALCVLGERAQPVPKCDAFTAVGIGGRPDPDGNPNSFASIWQRMEG
jgi:hypothetical protein